MLPFFFNSISLIITLVSLIQFINCGFLRTKYTNGIVYYLIDKQHPVSFNEAVQRCWNPDSDPTLPVKPVPTDPSCQLASFRSFDEQLDILRNKMRADYELVWFGAMVIGNSTESNFINSNQLIRWRSVWDQNEPNDRNAPCRGIVFVKSSNRWRDEPCSHRHPYICMCGQYRANSRPLVGLNSIKNRHGRQVLIYDDTQSVVTFENLIESVDFRGTGYLIGTVLILTISIMLFVYVIVYRENWIKLLN